MTLLELALKIAMSCGFVVGQSPSGELARAAAAQRPGEDSDADVVEQFRGSAVGRYFAAEVLPLLDRLVEATSRDDVEAVLEAFLEEGIADRFVAEILAFIREHQGEPLLAVVAELEADAYADMFSELDDVLSSRYSRQVARARELVSAMLGSESVQEVLLAAGEAVELPELPGSLVDWLYEASVPLALRDAALRAIRSSLAHWGLGRMVHRGEVPADPALHALIDTWVDGLEHVVSITRMVQNPEALAEVRQDHERLLLAYAKLTDDPGVGGLR